MYISITNELDWWKYVATINQKNLKRVVLSRKLAITQVVLQQSSSHSVETFHTIFGMYTPSFIQIQYRWDFECADIKMLHTF